MRCMKVQPIVESLPKAATARLTSYLAAACDNSRAFRTWSFRLPWAPSQCLGPARACAKSHRLAWDTNPSFFDAATGVMSSGLAICGAPEKAAAEVMSNNTHFIESLVGMQGTQSIPYW